MNCFVVTITTPEKSEKFDSVISISATSIEGDFAVMALHEPMVVGVLACNTKLVLEDGNVVVFSISSGTMVIKNNHCSLVVYSSKKL